MTLIYIGGPITGHKDLNKPAFDAAEEQLVNEGYIVFNPHSIPAPGDPFGMSTDLDYPKKLWRYYMRYCVRELTKCDELYLLVGWQNSDGAVWEYRIANMLGMPIRYQEVV